MRRDQGGSRDVIGQGCGRLLDIARDHGNAERAAGGRVVERQRVAGRVSGGPRDDLADEYPPRGHEDARLVAVGRRQGGHEVPVDGHSGHHELGVIARRDGDRDAGLEQGIASPAGADGLLCGYCVLRLPGPSRLG